MALDPEFVADSFYGPEALLIDEILEVDREESRVVVRMPVHDELPLTRDQRVDPVRHPRHVSGGLMVHMTGIVGWVHAWYVLGLRHADGWVGYGGRIYRARYPAMADMSEPLRLEGKATMLRRGDTRIFGRYELRFTQGEQLVYEGDQAAMWLKVAAESDAAQ